MYLLTKLITYNSKGTSLFRWLETTTGRVLVVNIFCFLLLLCYEW